MVSPNDSTVQMRLLLRPPTRTYRGLVLSALRAFYDSSLANVDETLRDIAGDGDNDSHNSFNAIKNKGGNPLIAPRKDVKIKTA
jgi:hypothetical protein